MLARPTWRWVVRDAVAPLLRDPRVAGKLWSTVRRAVETTSALWRQEQRAHAEGTLAHALAPGSWGSLSFLVSGGAISWLRSVPHIVGPAWSPMRDGFSTAVSGSERDMRRAWDGWSSSPDPHRVTPSLAARMVELLMRGALLVLWKVPYEDILREGLAAPAAPPPSPGRC